MSRKSEFVNAVYCTDWAAYNFHKIRRMKELREFKRGSSF